MVRACSISSRVTPHADDATATNAISVRKIRSFISYKRFTYSIVLITTSRLVTPMTTHNMTASTNGRMPT